MTDFYREQIIHKPKKEHKCFLCLQKIEGEHVYISCKHYDFWTGRAHMECNEKSKEICKKCGDSGYCDCDMSECYRESIRQEKQYG